MPMMGTSGAGSRQGVLDGAQPPHMQQYNENAAQYQAPAPTFEANRRTLGISFSDGQDQSSFRQRSFDSAQAENPIIISLQNAGIFQFGF